MSTHTTLIPKQSTISPSAWLAVVVLAIVLHLVFFLQYQPPQITEGAKNKGSNGIQIGLKKIPTMPAAPPKPKTVVKPPVIPKPKPVIKKKPKPIVKPKPVIIPEVVAEPEPVEEAIVDENPVADDNNSSEAESQAAPAFFGGGNPEMKAAYETTLLVWLERYKRYPSSARRRGQEDRIELEFVIDKDGNVLSHKIVKSSSYSSLNKAVTKMIKRASPLPSVPEGLRGNSSTFTYVVPILFELR